MTAAQIIALVLVFAAAGGYVNHRYMKLPASIGSMTFALAVSLFAMALGRLGLLDLQAATGFLRQIDFSQVLLHGMLSFLLFAGALHIRFDELRNVKGPVFVLATAGVVGATLITGTLFWIVADAVGIGVSWGYAFLFGALISPTDPIAVLAILKEVGISRTLYVKVGAESLFNDGVAVVLFLTIMGVLAGTGPVSAPAVAVTLVREALGGTALGIGLGWLVYRLISTIDDYKVEALLTLALAAGGYSLAEALHVSAPICIVIAGLIMGNHGRKLGMSERTRKQLDAFWDLVDEILNAVLFLLMGFEIAVIPLPRHYMALGLLAVVAVLVGRFVSVALPIWLMSLRKAFEPGTIRILTWGGLRGGLSIAMALSLPPGDAKDLILAVTYVVVLFSILVQGLSFGALVRSITGKQ